MLNQYQRVSGSFRDPVGFLFYHNQILYRAIKEQYQDNYSLLKDSGLYQSLVEAKLLIPHQEIEINQIQIPELEHLFKIIQPEEVPFISYPYEWSFHQLKAAALATLKIQQVAFEYKMSLKDSSAYNIQFVQGKAILIDTLSFEKYREGQPWIAYQQFCQHFLAPLALMSYQDVRLSLLLRAYIDGIPLDLASKMLPKRTYLRFSFLSHLHLHAKSQKLFSEKKIATEKSKISKLSFAGLIDHLTSTIQKLKWKPQGIGWDDYEEKHNYSLAGEKHKQELVKEFIGLAKPKSVWDFGANQGKFSRLASNQGIFTVAFDSDPAVVEKNCLEVQQHGEKHLLPLWLDLTNPSPSLGWAHQERDSLVARGPVDLAMALALIHHLTIAKNVPLHSVAAFFDQLCDFLMIEFVPKTDSQIQKLLQNREDIFDAYDQLHFEEAFKNFFEIRRCEKIKDSKRILYLMQRKPGDMGLKLHANI